MATITRTLADFRALRDTPGTGPGGTWTEAEVADDLAAGELLLMSCEPPLSGAAVTHLMEGLRRSRAGLPPRTGMGDGLGRCAQ